MTVIGDKIMKNKCNVLSILVVFSLSILVFSGAVLAQDKADREKLYKKIPGSYEFDADGQLIVLIFTLEEGTLYGQTEGDDEIVELVPDENSPLEFSTVDEDGQDYAIKFVLDEESIKITKCIIATMGMEL